MAIKSKEPCCQACGVPWMYHAGIVATCSHNAHLIAVQERLLAENKLLRQSLGIQRLLRAILETPSKPSTPRRKATKPQR